MILCYYVVRIVKQKVSHSVNAKTRQCAPMLTETFLAAMRRHAKHAHVSRATLGESRETAWLSNRENLGMDQVFVVWTSKSGLNQPTVV